MSDATARNPEGKISQSAVVYLREALRGALLQPFDPGYGEARSIWNGMIVKQPALIARVTGMADVITCVNFALDNGLPLSVRGGRHNIARAALCGGGLIVHLH